MRKIVFKVEIGKDGYSAWHEPKGGGIAATMGDNLTELKKNAVESYNSLIEGSEKKAITEANIHFVFDIPLFFDYFKAIKISELAKRIGMNYTLLNDYSTGVKVPSEAQTKKILQGVKQLGRELVETDFI